MRRTAAVLLFALFAAPAVGQEPKSPAVPDLREIVAKPQSEFAAVVRFYEADRGNLQRTYSVAASPQRTARLRRFHADWLAAVQQFDAGTLSADGKTDHGKLLDTIRRDQRELEREAWALGAVAPLLPFAATITELEDARRRMEPVDSPRAAGRLHAMKKVIDTARKAVDADTNLDKGKAAKAADVTTGLRAALKNWFTFYNGYDPLFTWWLAEPYRDADAALTGYITFLRGKAGGANPIDVKEPIVPDAVAAKGSDVPNLAALVAQRPSELRGVIQRFQGDRVGTGRRGATNLPLPTGPRSAERIASLTRHHNDWLAALAQIEFDKLSRDGQVDFLLLKNHITRELLRLKVQEKARAKVTAVVPFEAAIDALDAARKKKEKVDADAAAEALKKLMPQIDQARQAAATVDATTAAAAVPLLVDLRLALREWAEYAKAPADAAKAAITALEEHTAALRKTAAAKAKDDSGIEGRPIGRDALVAELAGELIPYSPEELMDLAEKEYAWCEAEMKAASRAMGFGDDWKKAVEKVKTLHVQPGQQPQLIRDLANEAIDHITANDLVTVPPLARETWRMEMMTPQRQLLNPFFTGGEVITVSFPTNTMSHESKLQTLRGNNVHFSRATVHHELFPGHGLQQYMTPRYRPHRGLFTTPFWTEGWALYWEFVLYARGFPKTPEDRVGFLFWRMHRCARIVFSLGYHLGAMSPGQCVDYLVAKVGHERENAAAEVRRSFVGGYGALYQAAYMLGGVQIRALRRELVESGKMTERDFHDAVLQGGRIPIALVRASLAGEKLTPELPANWRFYQPPAVPAATPGR